MKGELAAAMEGAGQPAATRFTRDELRDLFRLNTKTVCETRDLLSSLPSGADWQVTLLPSSFCVPLTVYVQ